jgi:hypothetical protein
MLAELLPGIALEVVEIRFIVAVPKVLTELQIYFEILKDFCKALIGFDNWLGHFVFP